MAKTPILAITSGEPAGVGPDLCAALLSFNLPARLVVLGDFELIQTRSAKPCVPFVLNHPAPKDALEIKHIPLNVPAEAGLLDKRNAPYVLQLLDCALEGIVQGTFDAMVTAPVHKGIINDFGLAFSGHTEYLAQHSAGFPVMMLAGEQKNGAGMLRVALASTHLPLKEVPSAITEKTLIRVLSILLNDLRYRYGIEHPLVKVAGLNPHAGENGHLGKEEMEIIAPVIAQFQQNGARVLGPFSADTLFTQTQLANVDAVLAMYHDQGLAPLKYATFSQAANITLGLPFIRTSVDHGTALDLAGTQKACPGSLKTAITEALFMVSNQHALR